MKNITKLCIPIVIIAFSTSCKKASTGKTTAIDSLKVGLIAYYAFDNNSGVDSSGRGNTATLFNLPSVPDRSGKNNSAAFFDGSTSYATVADNQDLRLNNTNFTLSAWVKIISYTFLGQPIINKYIYGDHDGWNWGIVGTGQFAINGMVIFNPDGPLNTAAIGTQIIDLNQWHLMTSTYNNTTKQLSIYIDGTLDNVTSNIPSPNANTSSLLYIGRDNPSSSGAFFQGYLDEVRIYNRILSKTDILKLYAK